LLLDTVKVPASEFAVSRLRRLLTMFRLMPTRKKQYVWAMYDFVLTN
jgi:hypothetical protein